MQSKLLDTIHSYDVSLYSHYLARGYRPLLVKTARLISHSGDGFYYPVAALLLYVSTHYFDSLTIPASFYVAMLAAYAVERIIYFSMKHSCKRKRPAQAIIGFRSAIKPSDEFSFPSGHTSGAFVFATFLASSLPEAGSLILLWACSVGLSRFFLGVHFITDIVIGALLGSTIALAALQLLVF